MLRREIQTFPTFIYPHDPWRLVEKKYNPPRMAQMETLFALANGYLGIRGTFEEGHTRLSERHAASTAFHETWPIVYPESAYGYARTGQTIVNAPDGTLIRLYVDDEPFDLARATLVNYERTLDMRTGILERDVTWEKGSGKRIRIRSRRLVSFEHRHVAAVSYEVTLLNADAPIVISSELVYQEETRPVEGDPRGSRAFAGRVLLPQGLQASGGQGHPDGDDADQQNDSGLRHGPSRRDGRLVRSEELIVGRARPRGHLRSRYRRSNGTAHKAAHVPHSRATPVDELAERAERALDRAGGLGFEGLAAGQQVCLDRFWDRADVEVRGDVELQQVMRFNIFHIHQASARTDGMGVPAKGLTGHGYEGHYFWDTEIYVLPFLIYTSPQRRAEPPAVPVSHAGRRSKART